MASEIAMIYKLIENSLLEIAATCATSMFDRECLNHKVMASLFVLNYCRLAFSTSPLPRSLINTHTHNAILFQSKYHFHLNIIADNGLCLMAYGVQKPDMLSSMSARLII
jgi:hypothetical protein